MYKVKAYTRGIGNLKKNKQDLGDAFQQTFTAPLDDQSLPFSGILADVERVALPFLS